MYWYDGRLLQSETINLSISEPGLLYGATVFTTMRVYQQSLHHPLTHYQAHCDRITHSLNTFNWQQPDWQRIATGIKSLLIYFPVIRIAIFPDGRELITGRALPQDLIHKQRKGITAWIAKDSIYRRDIAHHKTGSYLSAYLARQKALQMQAQEAILIDSQDNWLETSTGNLWGYKNDCWYTPALASGILPGIARSHLLDWLHKQHIPIRENLWTLDFVNNLDALAYSNCVVEIVPIHSILGRSHKAINQLDNLLLATLQQYFSR